MWVNETANFIESNKARIRWAMVVALTAFGYVAAFPPFNVPESAFVFLVPLIVWLRTRPSYRMVAYVSLSSSWVAWLVLIFWLRNVTYLGLFLLSGVVACHFMLFALGANWLARRFVNRDPWLGVAFAVGVASWWVVVEYVRGWIFTGFPWLPLSASQWDRPIMLQSAEVFGSWSISFILGCLNVGLASYSVRIYEYARSKRKVFCPEFYMALILFVCMTFLQTRRTTGQERAPLLKAAVLQPAVPQDQKWDKDFALRILERLKRNTLLLKPMKPDLVFWPEATTPYPFNGDDLMNTWANSLVNELEIPIMAGAIALEEDDRWFNGVFLLRPQWGTFPSYYSKRHLVPFGEYIPLRGLWPWLTKVVPLEGDFSSGNAAEPIPVALPESTFQVAPLICYEDIFPNLARSSVQEGADMLFVASNSAWFGRGGAAAQHMAHSVMRAVETRRVVLRVGNDGWTGWIDEFGNVKDSFELYTLGGTAWEIDRDRRWIGKKTFYVEHGDWFVLLCFAVIAVLGLWGWKRGSSQEDRPKSLL